MLRVQLTAPCGTQGPSMDCLPSDPEELEFRLSRENVVSCSS